MFIATTNNKLEKKFEYLLHLVKIMYFVMYIQFYNQYIQKMSHASIDINAIIESKTQHKPTNVNYKILFNTIFHFYIKLNVF